MTSSYQELILEISKRLENTGDSTALDVARRIRENPTLEGVQSVINETDGAPLDVWFTMIRGGLNDKGNVFVEGPNRAGKKELPIDRVSINEMAGQVITLDTLEVYLERLKK
jgi:hypothetical protein